MRSFIKISGTVFNLQSRHEYMVEMAMFNVLRAITRKVGKPGSCVLQVVSCVKFGENISYCIRIMERTRMMEALMDGWTLKISDSIT